MAVIGKSRIAIEMHESTSGDMGVAAFIHRWFANDLSAGAEGYFERANGSSTNEVRYAYSDSNSVANGAPVTYDLRGGLTSQLGAAAMAFAPVVGFAVRNKSATTAQNLQIGAGSNPFITWLLATGDGVVVGPGGFFAIESPIDGFATTAGTADILQIAASTSTISFDLLVWGR